MAKRRVPITKTTRDRVLAEFNHRCAVCGADRPHIHHIDEDPGNNEAQNLLPLCPNCHLVDQHNPTAPIDPAKLALFRRYKDPVILSPHFHPLFERLAYLLRLEHSFDFDSALAAGIELVAFINALKMGGFYHVRVAELVTTDNPDLVQALAGKPDTAWRLKFEERDRRLLTKLLHNRDRAVGLIVEMLRYQDWPVPRRSAPSGH